MDSLTLQGNLITVLVWFAVMFLLEVFFFLGGGRFLKLYVIGNVME